MSKHRLIVFLLILSGCVPQANAAVEFGPSRFSTGTVNSTVANLPASPSTGSTRYVTDGSTTTDCTVGGGASLVLCIYNGTVWGVITGTAVTPTLDQAFDQGKVIDGANSVANAFRVGDGTTPMCFYTDASLGPVITPCTDANVRQRIPTNFTGGFYDTEGATDIFTIDPDAASVNAMYSFGTAYKPVKSVWIGAGAMSTDGTQCAAPAEATPLANGVKLWTIICTDNDAGRMHFSLTMPDSWDAGTVTLESTAVQTAASAGVIEYQAAMQCKGDTEALVATSSYGSEVVWTDTMTGSSGVNHATSGAITPAGTCTAGDFVSGYIDIGATNTTTAMATLHTFGFKLEYSTSSLSD